MTRSYLALGATLLLASHLASAAQAAAPRFAELINDHAVLQRDQPVRLWGYADPSTALTLSLAGKSVAVTAGSDGKWQMLMPALPAGGPYELTVSDATGRTQTVKDIMVGEVWFCSGQSNMGYLTKNATNATNEIRDSANDQLRFVDIPRKAAASPQDAPAKPAPWQVAGPDTVGETSAACYYMSQALQKDLGVTVGFISSSWGGTQGQSWISAKGLRPLKTYDAALDRLDAYAADPVKGAAAQQAYITGWWAAHEPDARAKLKWASLAYDDSAWKTVIPVKVWERYGDPDLEGFNGAVWYRTTLELTADQAAKASELQLGTIDDSDQTFVNGVLVGGTEGNSAKRAYAVPPKAFKAGKNVIAVRVLDSGGSGGLFGKTDTRLLKLSDGATVPLPAQWKYKVSADLATLGETPVAPLDAAKGTASLYNGMIAPAINYTVKGVAWYQGEANVSQPEEYARLLPALIADWRDAFRSPDLPFLVVQLPNYGPAKSEPAPSNQAALREAQRRTALALPKVGLAVIVDIGDRFDIHPAQKKEVGRRLSVVAQRVAYGQDVPVSPAPAAITRSGPDITIRFSDTGKGLKIYGAAQATGFEVCTATFSCRYALAAVSGDTVTLPGANQPEIKFIRYAWSEAPFVNLFNSTGLPAVPFESPVD